jgi:hypothetical protein
MTASDLASVASEATAMARTKDVYFGISPQDLPATLKKARETSENDKKINPPDVRGFMETAMAMPGVWADIDVKGEGHKENDLPPSIETAVQLAQEFPLQPTVLVHSGHGLQAWWLFKEPWVFDSPDERHEAQDLSQRFQATLRVKAEAHGWKLDSTHDLARVLRLPGTYNRKLKPVQVKVISCQENNRYEPASFEEYLIDMLTGTQGRGAKINPASVLAGVPEGQRDITLFKYACRLRAKGMSKEEAEALVLQAAANCEPPFPEADAREKVRSAWKYPEGTETAQIISVLPDRPELAFEPETIGALAVLRRDKPGEYSKIKQSLKGKINLNDLERTVSAHEKESRKLKIVETGEPPPLLEQILPDIPLKELRKPYAWTFNENGIWTETKNGPICACSVPIMLTKRLINIESGEEKIELTFYRDKKWKHVIANRATIFNKTSIINIGNKSLPVSSENAKYIVKYFDDLERCNLDTIPVIKSTSHMGWCGNAFLPGLEGNVLLEIEEGGTSSVVSAYNAAGTLEEWIEITAPLRNYPVARFVLAAGFASPLLKITSQRVFIVHLWGGSRGGKTAAVKAALSPWGDPEETIVTFYGTKVGLERLAAFYHDLPMGIDERQIVGDKQGFIESLVYMMGTGKGKVRGKKDGGLQLWNTWRTIIMTTGEEPLSSLSSTAGIKTRVLELYGIPIGDEDLAGKMHQQFSKNHGTAGPAFIKRMMEELGAEPNMIINDFENIGQEIKKNFGNKIASHIAAVTLISIADYYLSMWIYNISSKEALEQSMDMAATILKQLDTVSESEDSLRAYEYIQGWYGINAAYFEKNSPGGIRFGVDERDYLYIYPPAFDKAMKDGGFNPARILRDWAKLGIVKTETRAGENTTRMKVRKIDPFTQKQSYFIAIKMDGGLRSPATGLLD